MATFQHVLAATDFSPASARAIELAVAIARESAAQLTVVYTCEIPVLGDVGPPLDLITPLADAAQVRLEDVVKSLREACPGARGVVRVGAPWEQILAVAGEIGADLIVVGTQGRRGLAHALLGSVAERVVRLSPVPVLTVRPRGNV